ncbi:hypothetical protein GpartN1_g2948.t1 [Galdieria partita]|uniref:Chromo domain-containing protein n=1 Tax=Galdieria partita TaxID=83374 RepID=A0A9C7PX46_9RHOD|nr:hypothetical protein GpartN1_g2948.t1 [Galdieria partita]
MNPNIRVSVKMPKYMQDNSLSFSKGFETVSSFDRNNQGNQDSSSRENSSVTGSRQDENTIEDTPRYKHNHRLGIACPACSASKYGKLPSDFFQRAAAKEEESLNRLFSILRNILDDQDSELFKGPSQERQVQKRPIDLTTLRENLHQGKYRLRHDMFIKDLRQLFRQTLVYYDADSRLGRAARKFLHVIEEGLEPESNRTDTDIVFHAGDRVDVLGSDNQWHSATVVQVQGSKYYIHFDGSSVGVDEQIDVRSSRVAPFDSYARQKVPYREPPERMLNNQKLLNERQERNIPSHAYSSPENSLYSLKRKKPLQVSSSMTPRSVSRGRPSAVFFTLQLKPPVVPSVSDIGKSLFYNDTKADPLIEIQGDACFEDTELTIERLISRRFRSETRSIEYLVKWKNYGINDSSWEPRETLLAVAPSLVADFDTRHPEIPLVAHNKAENTSSKQEVASMPDKNNEEEQSSTALGSHQENETVSGKVQERSEEALAKAQSLTSFGKYVASGSQVRKTSTMSNDPVYIVPHGFGTVAKQVG